MKNNNKVQKRYNRIAPIYDLMEIMMEKGRMGYWREELWQHLIENIPSSGGKLLEAGVGTGKNIEYYPEGIELYAIDFSEKMLERAHIKADEYQKNVKLIQMDIQRLEFPDNYFDIIVTSCVFCSVPDPVKGLKELRRVCKNDGNIFMLEHMRTEREPWGKLMDTFNWVSLYAWGANINRRTMNNIDEAGLKIDEVNDLWLDIVKEIVLKP